MEAISSSSTREKSYLDELTIVKLQGRPPGKGMGHGLAIYRIDMIVGSLNMLLEALVTIKPDQLARSISSL